MVVVRGATAEELSAIQRLHRRSVSRLATGEYDRAQVTAWQESVDSDLYPLDSAESTVLVAEADDMVGVGWMYLSADEYLSEADVDSELGGLYVDPATSREGVGTRLCNRLEAVADAHGRKRIGLWASLNAVPFYRERGYESLADRTIEYETTELPVVEMRKQLMPRSPSSRVRSGLSELRTRLSRPDWERE